MSEHIPISSGTASPESSQVPIPPQSQQARSTSFRMSTGVSDQPVSIDLDTDDNPSQESRQLSSKRLHDQVSPDTHSSPASSKRPRVGTPAFSPSNDTNSEQFDHHVQANINNEISQNPTANTQKSTKPQDVELGKNVPSSSDTTSKHSAAKQGTQENKQKNTDHDKEQNKHDDTSNITKNSNQSSKQNVNESTPTKQQNNDKNQKKETTPNTSPMKVDQHRPLQPDIKDESKAHDEDKQIAHETNQSTNPKESSPTDDVKTPAKSQQETREPEPESDNEEKPLDLAAIREFEYEQVAKLTPVQLRRYEQYRRSDLTNPKVKKVLVQLNPLLQKASEQYVIAVKGLAKLFVGDVVETALQVRKQYNETGPLQPKHLREAYRRLRRDGIVPTTKGNGSHLA